MKTKVFLVLFLFALVACQKVEVLEKEAPEGKPSWDFEVPAGFTWDVHKAVEVSVNLVDQYDGLLDYAIEIYSDNKLLDRGFASGTETYSAIVIVEKIDTTLVVVQVDPNGERVTRSVSINGNSAEIDFDDAGENPFTRSGNSQPSVPDNATKMTGGEIDLESGKTYVLNTPAKKVINAEGVVLYVAKGGNFQLIAGTKLSNSTIYILEGGKVVGVTTDPHDNLTIVNYNEFHLYGDVTLTNSRIENKVDAEIYVYNLTLTDSYLETNGLLLAGIHPPIYDEPGEINFTGVDFNTGTGKIVFKDTEVIVGKHFGAKTFKSEGGTISFKPHGWIRAQENMECLNTKLIGSVDLSKSAVIVSKTLHINSEEDVTGRIVLDAVDGITVGGIAKWDGLHDQDNPKPEVLTSIYKIQHSIIGYNDGGYKSRLPEPIEKPTDVVYFEQKYTILMEDNYPNPGDMDLNDIVCEWQLGTHKNEQELVTKIGLQYTVVALGSTRKLAGAVALRGISKQNIKSVQYIGLNPTFGTYFITEKSGVELGNNDIVIPLFKDAHKLFFDMESPDFVNTYEITNEPVTLSVIVELVNPVNKNDISKDDMDFFIVTSGDINKRIEIHLFGNHTTEKASNSFDFTNVNNVFGFELVDEFSYPKELTHIQDAYTDFNAWVLSGGTTNKVWYKYPVADKTVKYQE